MKLNTRDCKNIIKQETCIFSYFIIKSAFLNFNKTLKFFSNKDYLVQFQDYIILY